MESVSIVGVGRMGGALAIALSRAGYEIDRLVYRSTSPDRVASMIAPTPISQNLQEIEYLNSDIVLIATPDPEIAVTAARLAGKLRNGTSVFHVSGVLSSKVLSVLAATNETGSFHPLVSVSDPVIGSGKFAGSYFCVEGTPSARLKADAMTAALKGHSFTVRTDRKALYHAAAVTASGHLTALVDIATEMLSKCGITTAEAETVLMPLIKSTIGNLELQGPKNALTGPYARADADAFEAHLLSFEGTISTEIREIYLALAQRSLEIVKHSGTSPERVAALRERIVMAKKGGEC